MSGLPASGGVYNAGIGQEIPQPDGPVEGYLSAPIFQDGYQYPVYTMGQAAYPAGAVLPSATAQYGSVQPVLHQGLNFASPMDIPFRTQQLPATMAPSVLHIPPIHATPDRSNPSLYLDARSQMTSTSAPAISVGDWVSQGAPSGSAATRKPTGLAKKPRQQFSACTACRIRRVKCDLKDLRVEWEKQHAKNVATPSPQVTADGSAVVGPERGRRRGNARGKPNLAAISRKEDIRCTNCHNRDSKCMCVFDCAVEQISNVDFRSDEFAHRKRLRSSARDTSPSKGQEEVHSDSPTKPYAAHPSEEMADQDQELSLAEDDMDDGLPRSKAAEKYLLPPEPSGPWRTPPNVEDFYSPLEEKSAIDFGEISGNEGSQLGSRGTWDATEDEEAVIASTLKPEHQDALQDPQMEVGFSADPANPVEHTALAMGAIIDTQIHHDGRAHLAAADPITNSSAGSRPLRHSSPGRPFEPRGHQDIQPNLSIPDLDIAFFESDFYKRFHTQSTSPACIIIQHEVRTNLECDRTNHRPD
jgi:hypothetical protein